MRSACCSISGSFQRFLPAIAAKIRECKAANVKVLSPPTTSVGRVSRGFVFLKNEDGSPREIEQKHLAAIRRSDFLYVVNPEGYLGPSVTPEVGYAIAHFVPVFCQERPTDYMVSLLTRVEPSVDRIRQHLKAQRLLALPKGASLQELQQYVRRMVHARGFEQETLRDVVLLFIEEVGELAKAVRRELGLKIDLSKQKGKKLVPHELADCLVYLLDMANLAGIDLEAAFRGKERLNAAKSWKSQPSRLR
jgi:NTP pyrophosphatase (non-canonical NTP hydrolase)